MHRIGNILSSSSHSDPKKPGSHCESQANGGKPASREKVCVYMCAHVLAHICASSHMISNRMGIDDSVYGILLWQSEQNKAHHEVIPAVKMSEQILGHQEGMICSLLLLQPRKKDPSFPLLSTDSSHTGSLTVPRCPQSRYSGRRSRYEGLSGLIWFSVSQHCGHIPNRTQFQSQQIFMKIYLILFKLEIPSLSPVTFRQRPPSQQMLKMVKTISHVD